MYIQYYFSLGKRKILRNFLLRSNNIIWINCSLIVYNNSILILRQFLDAIIVWVPILWQENIESEITNLEMKKYNYHIHTISKY